MNGQLETMRNPVKGNTGSLSEWEIGDQLKLTKLTESDNIETFRTMFERMMEVYGRDEAR